MAVEKAAGTIASARKPIGTIIGGDLVKGKADRSIQRAEGTDPKFPQMDGELAFATFQGGTTGDKFLTYLKDVLIPTLRPGDIVVMDNLRTSSSFCAGTPLPEVSAVPFLFLLANSISLRFRPG